MSNRRLNGSRRRPRDYRPSKAALFDSIEEGGIRVSSSYSQEIDECSNDSAINSLQDRVFFLKRLTGDMQWRAITVCWTGWAMRWMHQGESCLEL